MKPLNIFVIGLIAATLLAGCTAGTDFTRAKDDAVVLGTTTYQSIRDQMGAPEKEGVITQNGQKFHTLTYTYASSGGEPLYSGATPGRTQVLFFKEDVLVGHEFLSSFKEDNTDFDERKISEISEEVSLRADVISLLGEPSGMFIHPLADNENGETIVYSYTHVTSSAFSTNVFAKRLLVELDNYDVVLNVEYSQSGHK